MSDERLSSVRRWLLPLALALAIGAMVAGWGARRGKPLHGNCLVNGDCLSTERCLVIPANDGFAVQGSCIDVCEDDLQCPAQMHCETFSIVGQTLMPKRADEPTQGGCAPGIQLDEGAAR